MEGSQPSAVARAGLCFVGTEKHFRSPEREILTALLGLNDLVAM